MNVDIVDLIEWGRKRGNIDERVQTFRTVAELRAYSKGTGKISRNTFDEEDSNVILRHLLRNISEKPCRLEEKKGMMMGRSSQLQTSGTARWPLEC